MSRENVELVREFFAACTRGDLDASLARLAPDVVDRVSLEAAGLEA